MIANENLPINRISDDAVAYLTIKMEEFGINLLRNSIPMTEANKRKTVFKEDLEEALDRVSLVLKNLPHK